MIPARLSLGSRGAPLRDEGKRVKITVALAMLLVGLAAASTGLAQSKAPASEPPASEPPASEPSSPGPGAEAPPTRQTDSFSDPNWNPDWKDTWAADEAAPRTLMKTSGGELPLNEDPLVPIIGESLIALLGATASAAGGFGLAYVTNKGCINSSSTNPLAAPFGCGFETAAADLLIWAPAGIFLTPFLVHTVGAGAGSYGSGVLGALVGGAAGTGLGVGLLKGINPESKAAGAALFVIPIVLFNAAGAVIGYELSVGENSALTRTPADDAGGTLTIAPWVSAETRGLAFIGSF